MQTRGSQALGNNIPIVRVQVNPPLRSNLLSSFCCPNELGFLTTTGTWRRNSRRKKLEALGTSYPQRKNNTTASWGLQTRVKNFDRTLKAPFGGFHWRAEEWDVA